MRECVECRRRGVNTPPLLPAPPLSDVCPESSPLTQAARLMTRTCQRECMLMRACPRCYLTRVPALHMLSHTATRLPLFPPLPSSVCEEEDTEVPQADDPPPPSVEPEMLLMMESGSRQSKGRGTVRSGRTSSFDPWWFSRLCVSPPSLHVGRNEWVCMFPATCSCERAACSEVYNSSSNNVIDIDNIAY